MTKSLRLLEQQQIVASARSYVGTKFKHQGRLKRGKNHVGGVDCLGLIVGVAKELNKCNSLGVPLHKYDVNNYSRLGGGDNLTLVLDANLTKISQGFQAVEAGDICLFEIVGQPQHLGFVGFENKYSKCIYNMKNKMYTMIHAYQTVGFVVEHNLSKAWQKRAISVYRF